jgi:two-component system NarL family sensor kinase
MVVALAIAVVALAALCAYLGLALARARGERHRFEAFLGQVMDADDASRRRIAQMLHDEVLQSLLAANQELYEAAPGRPGVTRAHEVVSRTIADVREAAAALHPVTLEQGGLDTALAAIVRRAEHRGGFPCTLEVDPEATGVHDELIVGVARELLTNAAKHAGASAVSVTVARRGSEVVLEVLDDGRGIEPGRREAALRDGHIGLASAVYRVEAAGGSLALTGGPGAGTRAVARLPAPSTGGSTRS